MSLIIYAPIENVSTSRLDVLKLCKSLGFETSNNARYVVECKKNQSTPLTKYSPSDFIDVITDPNVCDVTIWLEKKYPNLKIQKQPLTLGFHQGNSYLLSEEWSRNGLGMVFFSMSEMLYEKIDRDETLTLSNDKITRIMVKEGINYYHDILKIVMAATQILSAKHACLRVENDDRFITPKSIADEDPQHLFEFNWLTKKTVDKIGFKNLRRIAYLSKEYPKRFGFWQPWICKKITNGGVYFYLDVSPMVHSWSSGPTVEIGAALNLEGDLEIITKDTSPALKAKVRNQFIKFLKKNR
jgi:hypothetical protein